MTSTPTPQPVYLLVESHSYDGYNGREHYEDYGNAIEHGHYATREAAERHVAELEAQQRARYEEHVTKSRVLHEQQVAKYAEHQRSRALLEASGADTTGITWASDPGKLTTRPYESWARDELSWTIEEVLPRG